MRRIRLLRSAATRRTFTRLLLDRLHHLREVRARGLDRLRGADELEEDGALRPFDDRAEQLEARLRRLRPHRPAAAGVRAVELERRHVEARDLLLLRGRRLRAL